MSRALPLVFGLEVGIDSDTREVEAPGRLDDFRMIVDVLSAR